MSTTLTPVELERAEAQDKVDRRMMAAALNFGRRNMGEASPNPSVGALVVRRFEGVPIIVGRGVTAAGGRPRKP
jgi:diaminohydroxyphosphoribosylaminopyrimidine deaminase/5-amino-6-(5-phosphoribosylamino)uracil reductase